MARQWGDSHKQAHSTSNVHQASALGKSRKAKKERESIKEEPGAATTNKAAQKLI